MCECDEKKPSVGDGKHRDSQGNLLRCCNTKLKTPSERYPLHAEWAATRWGITTEEYDRIFMFHKWDMTPYFMVG